VHSPQQGSTSQQQRGTMSGITSGASAGMVPVDASKLSVSAIASKSQAIVEPVIYSPCSKPQHTPMSQPSTAPSTPSLSFNLDPEGGHSIFYRCISGTSTIEPLMEQQEDDEDGWEGSDLPPLPDAQLELAALDSKPTEVQGSTGAPTIASLEDKLAEVKELYKARTGHDVDSESEYDSDGAPWIKTTGTGPLSVARLEDQLAEVKALYLERFGRDVDDSDDECECVRDSDGAPWIKTTGTGPLTVARLEDTLAEVKTLYREKFGRDVDEESDDDSEVEYDADGTPWTKTVGTGPLSMARLENMLAEVKTLYREKFGRSVDAESDDDSEVECDADGAPWIKVVGQGPLTLSGLEDKLAEVKAIYREKFGRDVDAESGDDPEVEYDADGTPWIQMVGTGMPAAQTLAEQQ